MLKKIGDIIVKNVNDSKSGVRYQINIPGVVNYMIEAYNYPTHNCQIFSIGYFMAIFSSHIGEDKHRKDIIKILWNECNNKPMLMLDLNESYIEKTIQLFGKDNVMLNAPYVSTRKTKMAILLINCKDLKDW